MKRFIVGCLAVLVFLPLFPQQEAMTISGKVMDESHQPVELANVSVLSKRDSSFIIGTCTKADGSFVIGDLPKGDYFLQISYVGYRTLCIPCREGSLGEVVMLQDAHQLGGVTVSAERPVYRMEAGVMTAAIPHTILASAGTGRDVLEHIPSIHVSDDGYSVFGKGTPIIYIDNHLVNDIKEVDRLQSKDIERVEVISNPGAEYGATVKSVIRIRTLKSDKDQFGADEATSVAQGRRMSYESEVNLKYKHRSLSLFGNMFYYRINDKRKQTTFYDITTTYDLLVRSVTRLYDKGHVWGAKTGMNFDINKKNSIGLSYELSTTPSFQIKGESRYTVRKDFVPVDTIDYRSDGRQKDIVHLVNAYYQGEMNSWKFDFTSDIVSGSARTTQLSDELSMNGNLKEVSSLTKAYNNMYAAKLMVSHPFVGGEMKVGTDYTYIRRRDRFTNPQEILPAANSLIHESKIAGFAEYSIDIGKVSAVAGLRFEHSSTKYWESGEYMSGQSKDYDDWMPNVAVDFPIGKLQSSLSYSVKKDRPSFHFLRSSVNYNNSYIYEGGNPLLIPATERSVDWSLSYRWIQYGMTYLNTKNRMDFQGKSYDKNQDVAIITMDNFKKYQCLLASLYLSPTVKIWSPVVGIELSKPFFDVNSKGKEKHMNRALATFTLNNSFKLQKSLVMTLDFTCQTKGDAGTALEKPWSTVNFGVRKSLLHDALNLQLQVNDIFVTHHDFDDYGQKLTFSKCTVPDSRQVKLTVRYSFHPLKVKSTVKHVSDEDLRRL